MQLELKQLSARLSKRSTDGLELDAAAVAEEIHENFSFTVVKYDGGAVGVAHGRKV